MKSLNSINNGKLLPEQAADKIAEIIVNGELSVGDRLPNEFQLAEKLNVGRGTVREAVKILASKNIVEIRRGTGTFVTEKPGVVEDPLGFTFIKDKEQLTKDLSELRSILEPEIAALAASRATDEDIKEIEAACKAVEDKILAGKPYMEEDVKLHETIAKTSKNLVVPNVIPVITSSVEYFIRCTDAKFTDQTINTHRAVVDAIKARDAKAAREAMVQHMTYNNEFIDNQLNNHKK